MVLEKGCFVIKLRKACLLIGYLGLIYAVLSAGYTCYVLITTDILNLTELIDNCAEVFFYVLTILSSIILLYGTYNDEPKCFAVWFGFAGCIIVTLFVSSVYNIALEFHCFIPLYNTVLGGLVVYCIFVVYSYYKELSDTE